MNSGRYSWPVLRRNLAKPIPAPNTSPNATPTPTLFIAAPIAMPTTSPIPTKGPMAIKSCCFMVRPYLRAKAIANQAWLCRVVLASQRFEIAVGFAALSNPLCLPSPRAESQPGMPVTRGKEISKLVRVVNDFFHTFFLLHHFSHLILVSEDSLLTSYRVIVYFSYRITDYLTLEKSGESHSTYLPCGPKSHPYNTSSGLCPVRWCNRWSKPDRSCSEVQSF